MCGGEEGYDTIYLPAQRTGVVPPSLQFFEANYHIAFSANLLDPNLVDLGSSQHSGCIMIILTIKFAPGGVG